MSHNPYSAPRSAVSDAAAPPMERPRVVVIAVALFWTEMALGLLDSGLRLEYLATGNLEPST